MVPSFLRFSACSVKILPHALKTYPLLLLLSSFIQHLFFVECSDVFYCGLSHGSLWKSASNLVFQSVVFNLKLGVLLCFIDKFNSLRTAE